MYSYHISHVSVRISCDPFHVHGIPTLMPAKRGWQKLLPDWTEPSITVFHWPGHLMNINADPNIEIIDSR